MREFRSTKQQRRHMCVLHLHRYTQRKRLCRVDAYQHSLDSGGTVAKRAPEDVCPAQFGNSAMFVSKINP
jgi:hypothetical protein